MILLFTILCDWRVWINKLFCGIKLFFWSCQLKGAVSVIFSEEWHARFTMVPFIPFSEQRLKYIIVFFLEKCWILSISFFFLLNKFSSHFYRKAELKIVEKGSEDTVVNQACTSLEDHVDKGGGGRGRFGRGGRFGIWINHIFCPSFSQVFLTGILICAVFSNIL